MSRPILSLALGAALTSFGCAKPVQVSHQGPASLSADLDTYAIVSHAVAKPSGELVELLHDAMARKGYRPAIKEDASLLVSIKTLRDDGASRAPLDPASLTLLGPDIDAESSTSANVEHVVVVLLEEARTERVLWLGWTAGESPRHQLTGTTRSSLRKILANIPQAD